MTVATGRDTRRPARRSGMMDVGQYPYGHWLAFKRAVEARELMLRNPRPWSPHFPVLWGVSGRSVPSCFGRCGYGDGLLGTGTCHRVQCGDADDCFALMRQLCEAFDPRMAEFNARLGVLRRELIAAGMDAMQAGRAAMQQLASGPHPRPLEEAMLANAELGHIDSGRAARCRNCPRVPQKVVMVDGLCPRCATERQGAEA